MPGYDSLHPGGIYRVAAFDGGSQSSELRGGFLFHCPADCFHKSRLLYESV